MFDRFKKPSHTRISSYILLATILINTFVYICIDIANLILSLNSGNPYVIPYEHIGIFGMLLGHHLLLVGYKKNEANELKSMAQSNMKNSTDIVSAIEENASKIDKKTSK